MSEMAWAGFRKALLREEMRLRRRMQDHNPAHVMAQLAKDLAWCEKAVANINRKDK